MYPRFVPQLSRQSWINVRLADYRSQDIGLLERLCVGMLHSMEYAFPGLGALGGMAWNYVFRHVNTLGIPFQILILKGNSFKLKIDAQHGSSPCCFPLPPFALYPDCL